MKKKKHKRFITFQEILIAIFIFIYFIGLMMIFIEIYGLI